MDKKRFFCLNDFQKWLRKEVEENNNKFEERQHVVARVSIKKIVERAEVHEGDIIEIAKCFRKNGGLVESVQDDIITVKTKKGIFSINERDIKRN